ncbi:MAG: hypothetical protein NC408_05140 [Candidatus Gastranaerophilales bacterium]|nr:hypothetical protein [Candidatus Gastranaerophilales bacterium]MCM1072962.1 hypothetical protein [Bacteroides sp.]
MLTKELEEREKLASKADALVIVTLDSCEKEDYTTQQIVLEEAQRYTSQLSEKLIELNFSI